MKKFIAFFGLIFFVFMCSAQDPWILLRLDSASVVPLNLQIEFLEAALNGKFKGNIARIQTICIDTVKSHQGYRVLIKYYDASVSAPMTPKFYVMQHEGVGPNPLKTTSRQRQIVVAKAVSEKVTPNTEILLYNLGYAIPLVRVTPCLIELPSISGVGPASFSTIFPATAAVEASSVPLAGAIFTLQVYNELGVITGEAQQIRRDKIISSLNASFLWAGTGVQAIRKQLGVEITQEQLDEIPYDSEQWLLDHYKIKDPNPKDPKFKQAAKLFWMIATGAAIEAHHLQVFGDNPTDIGKNLERARFTLVRVLESIQNGWNGGASRLLSPNASVQTQEKMIMELFQYGTPKNSVANGKDKIVIRTDKEDYRLIVYYTMRNGKLSAGDVTISLPLREEESQQYMFKIYYSGRYQIRIEEIRAIGSVKNLIPDFSFLIFDLAGLIEVQDQEK